MTLQVHVICVGILISIVYHERAEGASAAVNVNEFKALCALTRIADDAQTITDADWIKKLAKWSELDETIQGIEEIVNQTNSSEGTIKLTFDGGPVDLSNSQKKEVANRLLGPTKRRLTSLKNDRANLEKKAKEFIRDAKRDALRAIAGEDLRVGAAGAKILERYPTGGGMGSRDSGCKYATGACTNGEGRAGCNLIRDTLCLCIPGSGITNSDSVCGPQLTGTSVAWSSSSLTGTATTNAWDPLWEECGHQRVNTTFSATNLNGAITRFLHLLGKQSTSISSKPTQFKWILGKPYSTGACDGGQSSATAVCVNYADSSKNHALMEIDWLIHLENAQRNLEMAGELRGQVDRLQTEASALLLTTESTLLHLSVPENFVGTNSTVSGGTAHRDGDVTAQSHSPSSLATTTEKTSRTKCLRVLPVVALVF